MMFKNFCKKVVKNIKLLQCIMLYRTYIAYKIIFITYSFYLKFILLY